MKTILFFVAVAMVFSTVGFSLTKGKAGSAIKKEPFGKLPDGQEAYLYTLKNSSGMIVKVSNYGATTVGILVPDRNGKLADVALGYDNVKGYINGKSYFGGTIGRYANRIAHGTFKLNGKVYHVPLNDGPNSLHGGTIGFNKEIWTAKPLGTAKGPAVRFSYVSKAGEDGYPGTVKVTVTYTLLKDNALRVDYRGTTDKPTVLNMTNHTYFNLSGDPNKTILDEDLMIDASKYTPVNENLIPTGEIASVAGTPMDFRKMTMIGARINEDNVQLKRCGGYDLNWVLNDYNKKVRKVAEVYDPTSGRILAVYTDQPGIQFYTGNFLNGTEVGKGGVHYQHRTALTLETQLYPDSPNEPKFPSATLRPGQTYKQTTIYKFSVKK